ncbi:hypothetical protein CBL_08104 [Carabus blaptoides fortunei]
MDWGYGGITLPPPLSQLVELVPANLVTVTSSCARAKPYCLSPPPGTYNQPTLRLSPLAHKALSSPILARYCTMIYGGHLLVKPLKRDVSIVYINQSTGERELVKCFNYTQTRTEAPPGVLIVDKVAQAGGRVPYSIQGPGASKTPEQHYVTMSTCSS